MDISTIALGGTGVILVISILVLSFFGLRSVFTGKHELRKILALALPFVIFGISYGVIGTLADAAIFTMFVMIALMGLFILVSGLRSIF